MGFVVNGAVVRRNDPQLRIELAVREFRGDAAMEIKKSSVGGTPYVASDEQSLTFVLRAPKHAFNRLAVNILRLGVNQEIPALINGFNGPLANRAGIWIGVDLETMYVA